MSPATQDQRSIAVFTPLGRDVLLLRKFRGQDAISEPFSYELEFISLDDGVQPVDILGRQITWRLDQTGDKLRWFHGYVSEFEHTGRNDKYSEYRAVVRPWLWLLSHSTDCRIFQDKSTPDIVSDVFRALGHDAFEWKLSNSYEPRDYCVQYRESDFQFVSRLMEEEGIFYYFQHENGSHQLIMTDSVDGCFDLDDPELVFPTQDQMVGRVEQVKSWRRRFAFHSGGFAHTDFNFEIPTNRLLGSTQTNKEIGSSKALEVFEYPGRYQSSSAGRSIAKRRMEELETTRSVGEGTSTYRHLAAGGRFSFAEHRSPFECNGGYLIQKVETEASVPGPYQSGLGQGEPEFENRFECVPQSAPFRATRKTRRPRVEGRQTATVVGPSGEEIHTDEHGRIKVQFHWDRLGRKDEHSSCWIRVSQAHAGQGWGAMSLPRIGEEVIVSFLDGDPDRPIVKGRLYNASVQPPFSLPSEMTRSGGKSNTYQGSGFNEFSMDDTAGAEQVRANAQHNMDTAVGNSETAKVGVNSGEDVGNDRSQKVGVDSSKDIAGNHSLTVGNECTIDVANHLTLKAGTSITLTVGASSIHMNQAGVITISGEYVTSAAAAANTIVAPITNIAGSKMMNTVGLINLAVGGVCKVEGTEASVSGGSTSVRGGMVVVKGSPIRLGEAAPPVVMTAGGGGGGGGGGGPAGPDAPDSAASAAEGDLEQLDLDDGANGSAKTHGPGKPISEFPDKEKKVREAVEKLKNTEFGKGKEGQDVIKAIEDRLESGNIRIVPDDSPGHASYRDATDNIRLEENNFESPEKLAVVLAHEGTHALDDDQFPGKQPKSIENELRAFENHLEVYEETRKVKKDKEFENHRKLHLESQSRDDFEEALRGVDGYKNNRNERYSERAPNRPFDESTKPSPPPKSNKPGLDGVSEDLDRSAQYRKDLEAWRKQERARQEQEHKRNRARERQFEQDRRSDFEQRKEWMKGKAKSPRSSGNLF